MAAPFAQITTILRYLLRDPDLIVTAATCFEDIPGWDSMDLISVVVEVECRLDLQFEANEIDGLTTVDDLLRLISAKQALVSA